LLYAASYFEYFGFIIFDFMPFIQNNNTEGNVSVLFLIGGISP
jgi:hypothetical protein